MGPGRPARSVCLRFFSKYLIVNELACRQNVFCRQRWLVLISEHSFIWKFGANLNVSVRNLLANIFTKKRGYVSQTHSLARPVLSVLVSYETKRPTNHVAISSSRHAGILYYTGRDFSKSGEARGIWSKAATPPSVAFAANAIAKNRRAASVARRFEWALARCTSARLRHDFGLTSGRPNPPRRDIAPSCTNPSFSYHINGTRLFGTLLYFVFLVYVWNSP